MFRKIYIPSDARISVVGVNMIIEFFPFRALQGLGERNMGHHYIKYP